MLVWIVDAKANDYDVQEQWFFCTYTVESEIVPGVKMQFVNTGFEHAGFDNRGVGSAVFIGGEIGNCVLQVPCEKFDFYIGRWSAATGVKDVS